MPSRAIPCQPGEEILMPQHFDVVVVGIGPGGEVAVSRLPEAGRSVPVVERELVEMADHLMPREDPKVGAIIQPCLAEDGIGRRAVRAWRDGKVSVLELDDGSTLPGDVLTVRDTLPPSNYSPRGRGSARS